MEKNKTETDGDGIDSYGVSMTTLEEIFLKLGEEEEAKKLEEENRNKVGLSYFNMLGSLLLTNFMFNFYIYLC